LQEGLDGAHEGLLIAAGEQFAHTYNAAAPSRLFSFSRHSFYT